MRDAWLVCALILLSTGCTGTPSSEAMATPVTAGSSALPAQANGTTPDGMLPRVAGRPQQNDILRLEVTEAGFFPAADSPSPGRRYYTVGMRGTSLSASGQLLGASKGDDVFIDARKSVFAQNERGCVAQPEFDVAGVPNLFGDSMAFSPSKASGGRLTFLVPDDTERIRVLIAPAGAGGLAVPAGDDFTPAWPKPIHTIDDGTTMRILVLPDPPIPSPFPAAAPGREYVMLDVVVQNLKNDHGIEFQPAQQLRLMDPAGAFVMASAATQQLGCRMNDGEVIPPGQARRLLAVYEMPVGAARRLHYRGFEKEEALVVIK